MVIRQMATLAGYDPAKATGIFTQGGHVLQSLRLFCWAFANPCRTRGNSAWSTGRTTGSSNSGVGHYSNMTNLSLLGVNIRRKTIRIRATENNDMDLEYLEQQLTACFQLDCVAPAIMLTMGTTDTFGVDRVKPVREIRDRLCEQFDVAVKPPYPRGFRDWLAAHFLSRLRFPHQSAPDKCRDASRTPAQCGALSRSEVCRLLYRGLSKVGLRALHLQPGHDQGSRGPESAGA